MRTSALKLPNPATDFPSTRCGGKMNSGLENLPVPETKKPPRALWRRWSISTQLLLAVNVPLALALGLLLALDYRREMRDAIAEKHAGLNEEAMMIYRGLYYLGQRETPAAIQRYIDSVCSHMQESQSPGHRIAVRWRGGLLQAQPGQGSTPDILETMQRAAQSPDYLATLGDETLVVGQFSGRGVHVYVSEYTTSIRRSIRQNILYHLGSLVVLALVAASIVNPVLWRIVTRPMRRLSRGVARVAAGEYGVPVGDFHSRESKELSEAIETMSAALSANELQHRAQMAQAKKIQTHLLPQVIQIDGLDLARVFAPADAVAGDYYDLIRLPDDTWLICVADVTGHGIPAAFGSVILKTVLLSAAEHQCEPGRILQYVNQRLTVLLPDQFASMFLGRWVPASLRFNYASAGHEPGLLISPEGKIRLLTATGPLLGIDDAMSWDTEAVDLLPGERVLLTTDGVAEAGTPDAQLFGRERLAKVVEDCIGLTPQETVQAIHGAILEHQAGERPTDDLTILLMESKRLVI